MIYEVAAGDTLYSISEQFGVSVEQIRFDNQLGERQTLVLGQALLLLADWLPQETIARYEVTGYAYPFIQMELLKETLQYINELLVFSYGFTLQGELIPPKVNDLPLIEQAWSQGDQVSVALAPKTSAAQKGLLYEGMDYRLLGQNADYVFLMTYEWGYTYGPPMTIAPLNKVREVVEYAVTEIPHEKIMLGIPNYAYDWKLPFQAGVSAAELISNVEAVRSIGERRSDSV